MTVSVAKGLLVVSLAAWLPACAVVPIPGYLESAQGPLPPTPVGQMIEGAVTFGATGCRLALGEGVAIVDADGFGPDEYDPIRDVPARLRERFGALEPPVPVLADAVFRDALFPWFEPGREPFEPAAFHETVTRPRVRARIDELDLRYLIAVRGEMRADDPTPTLGLIGLLPALGMSTTEHMEVIATVWDLQQGVSIGDARVTAGGTWIFTPIIVGALATLPMTEQTAYEAMTARLEDFLRGDRTSAQLTVAEQPTTDPAARGCRSMTLAAFQPPAAQPEE